jgi:hypothetical protein
VQLHIPAIVKAVNAATPGSSIEVDIPLPPKKPFTRLKLIGAKLLGVFRKGVLCATRKTFDLDAERFPQASRVMEKTAFSGNYGYLGWSFFTASSSEAAPR